MRSAVGYESGLFPVCAMAAAVATLNEHYVEVGELVEVVMPIDAYLAHEALILPVGGDQFFSGSSSVSAAGSGSTTAGSLYHSFLSSAIEVSRVVMSAGAAS